MDKIRFGVIGAAGRGSGFIPTLLAHPATEVAALCDIRREEVERHAAELGVELVFTDTDEMLDAGGVDAVVVGTPMPWHVPQAIAALERDIHVLCEVTAGVSVEECRDLTRAARRSRAVYMMAENYVYTKPNTLVKALVERGFFGELYYAEGAYIHELKQLNETTPWRRRWQTGVNGCTYATHSLGPVLTWFAGQRVVAVCTVGTGHHYRDPRGDLYEMEDSVTMMCRLSGGGAGAYPGRYALGPAAPHGAVCVARDRWRVRVGRRLCGCGQDLVAQPQRPAALGVFGSLRGIFA